MVTRDDDSQNIYTVSIGQYNELTSYDESKYEDKHQNALICPREYISKEELSKISEKKTTLLYIFLVHIPYFINKEKIIHVFYHH